MDEIGPRSGTTTAVDTGTAGAHSFPGFRRFVIERAAIRILPFLNIASIGAMSILLAGELENIRYSNVEEAVRCVEANRDLIQGIKVRSSGNVLGLNGVVPLELGRAAAERVGLPMMVHIGPTPPSIHDILARMRPGDILTHCYTGHTQRIYDAGHKILPDALAARERGIWMDIGHGMGSLSFESAGVLLASGFKPDTISTDLHAYSYPEPVHDLPTTVSKFLALGLGLDDAIAAVTSTPARVLKRSDQLGSLRVGATADVALFELQYGEFSFVDSYGSRLNGTQKLVNTLTIKDGKPLLTAGR
jgi:dihydroorotase